MHFSRVSSYVSRVYFRRYFSGYYVDTHCHLDAIVKRWSKEQTSNNKFQFQDLRNTFPMNFDGCVTIGCNASALDEVVGFLSYDKIFGAFGIHPLFAKDWLRKEVQEKIKKLMMHEKCVAWGECGLDYFDKNGGGLLSDGNEKDLQKKVFVEQIVLAAKYNKPLVVHERSAAMDVATLLKQYLPKEHFVHVHCFTSTLGFAKELINYFPNLFIGFTGAVTFRRSLDLQHVAKEVPLDRILLETDGPYMAPEPHRGKVAHPGHIPTIGRFIAQLKGEKEERVLALCRENANRIYGI